MYINFKGMIGMKSKRIIVLLMCAAMLFCCVLSGCSAKNDEETVPSTAATADEVTADEAQPTEVTTAPATEATKETQPTTKKDTDKKEPAPTQPSYKPPVSADPKICTVTVANKNYKVNVGSVVTYTCYMKTPDKIEDVQAKVHYTGAALKLLDQKPAQLFPVLGSSAICNTSAAGILKYNAINLDGYDFTGNGALVTMRFQVLQSSSASIASTVEYVTGIGGVPYIDNCKVVSGMNVSLQETLN